MAQIGELRKAVKLLARRMRKQQINNLISKLHDPKTNQTKYDPKDIESIFKNYYKKIYKQTSVTDRTKALELLNTLDQSSIGHLQKFNCRNNH